MTYADDFNLRAKELIKINDIADAIDAINGQINANWTAYTPTYGGSGSMTYTSITTFHASYLVIGKLVFIAIRTTAGTIGGTPSTTITVSCPSGITLVNTGAPNFSRVFDNGAWVSVGGVLDRVNNTTFGASRGDNANWTAGTAHFGGLFIWTIA
jgi:hypothetical protein